MHLFLILGFCKDLRFYEHLYQTLEAEHAHVDPVNMCVNLHCQRSFGNPCVNEVCKYSFFVLSRAATEIITYNFTTLGYF